MTPRRLRVAVVAAALAVLAAYLSLWLQVTPKLQRGTDFSASYVAALLIREGDASQLYDQAAEASRHAAILLPDSRVDLPFITPPTTALLAVPFTVLDPGVAFRVFSLLQLLLLAASAWVAARAAPWPRRDRGARLAVVLAALAGTATLPFLVLAQWDGVCALGVALSYSAWRRDRRFAAGVWLALGFGIAKPHLALGLAAFMVGRRDLRALGGSAVGALGVVVVSIAGVGVSTTAKFLGATSLALSHTPAPSTIGLLGLAASWIGDGTAAKAFALAAGVIGIGAAAAMGWQSRSSPDRLEATLAGACTLSLVIAPHLLAHDLVVLVPAMVWFAGRVAALEARPWPGRIGGALLVGWLGLAGLVSLDAGNGAPAPPGRLVPWGLLAAAAATWGLSRREVTDQR